jgi:hypothetical protein
MDGLKKECEKVIKDCKARKKSLTHALIWDKIEPKEDEELVELTTDAEDEELAELTTDAEDEELAELTTDADLMG